MKKIWIEKSAYLDSVTLMVISKRVSESTGVDSALVAMATDTNLALLRETGFDLAEVAGVSANDVMIAISGEDAAALEAGLALAKREIHGGAGADAGTSAQAAPGALTCASSEAGGPGRLPNAAGLEDALRVCPEINLVLVSVPGRYAAYEARRALRRGKHVMIFSDNVTIEDEKRLKAMGEAEGLLVMGPDCGTAMINGAGLGFANAVPRGPVGIVSASGTGAQEVSSILARIGTGVSHIIGTGGRDVSDHIGGAMTKAGLQTLIAHDNTRVIVVISKAPSAAVAKEILATAEAGGKPCVVYFAGSADRASRGCVSFARTLTDAALEAAKAAGVARPSVMSASDGGAERLARCASRIPSGRKYVRGLYSGGTLAQEAVFVFGGRLSPIATNMKLPGTVLLGDPSTTKGHTIVDLGDDAFTRGRPHPMIDQAYRLVRLERELSDPETAVILLDVVLGYGCNPDPAREIAGALTRFRQAAGRGEEAALPVVIASVCGTAADPQNYDGQKLQLQSAGVEVAPTNALAAAWALDLLERR